MGLYLYEREWDSVYICGTVYILKEVGLYPCSWDCIYIRGSGTLFILMRLYMY